MDRTAAAALLLLLCLGTVVASRHEMLYGGGRKLTSTAISNYTAAYQSLSCSPGVQETPVTTQEVSDIITKLYATAQAGTPVTLRVSRPHFHSTASFVCPIGRAGSLNASQPNVTGSTAAATEVGILQTKLNKVLAVDPVKSTMRVGSGMTIFELLKEATKNNMSLQIGTTPIYAGLTVAGVLATSAHGTGDMTISTFADNVLEVTWVDGTGKVHVSKQGDADFTAFNGGLGVFGVMTELLIQLTPTSNAELITVKQNDTNMMNNINGLLKVSPHIMILWRPDAGSYNAYMLRPAAANATVDLNPAIEMSLNPNTKGEANQDKPFKLFNTVPTDDSSFFGFFCPAMKQQMMAIAWASVGAGAGAKRLANVTAPTNQLLGAECGEFCSWNNVNQILATAMDVEFTVEFDQLADWIAMVKSIFEQDLYEGGAKRYRCMGPGAMWIRFGAPCDGVTATPCGLKRPVYVQSTWVRSRIAPDYPMRYEFVADLIEEATLCK